MDIRIKGTWYSPDKRRSLKINDTAMASYYTVKENNKVSKQTQEVKVGKEGFGQFLDELVRNNWRHSTR